MVDLLYFAARAPFPSKNGIRRLTRGERSGKEACSGSIGEGGHVGATEGEPCGPLLPPRRGEAVLHYLYQTKAKNWVTTPPETVFRHVFNCTDLFTHWVSTAADRLFRFFDFGTQTNGFFFPFYYYLE